MNKTIASVLTVALLASPMALQGWACPALLKNRKVQVGAGAVLLAASATFLWWRNYSSSKKTPAPAKPGLVTLSSSSTNAPAPSVLVVLPKTVAPANTSSTPAS